MLLSWCASSVAAAESGEESPELVASGGGQESPELVAGRVWEDSPESAMAARVTLQFSPFLVIFHFIPDFCVCVEVGG
jgi:hypothetical protein